MDLFGNGDGKGKKKGFGIDPFGGGSSSFGSGPDLFGMFKDMKSMHAASKQRAALRELRGMRAEVDRLFGPTAFDEMERALKKGADWDELYAHYQNRAVQEKAHQEKLNNPPPIHGSASWADWRTLYKAGILYDVDDPRTRSMIYLGGFLNFDPQTRALNENWLHWPGESHILTVAPTGVGKSKFQLIHNLLNYSGSCVVYDPKGELYRATSFYRSQIGKVFRLAPFEDDTDSFNPVELITSIEDARKFAYTVYPEESDGDGKFWEDDARNFLTALLFHISRLYPANMERICDFYNMPTMKLAQTLKDIAAAEETPKSIRYAFDMVGGLKEDAIRAIQRSLRQKLAVWESEAVQRASNRNDFRFEDLKDEPITVYITVPFDDLKAFGLYVRTVLSAALDAMLANPNLPTTPVLFIIDEFLALGRFEKFVDALRTHRGAGVRLWFTVTGLSDIRDTYKTRADSFFTACEVKSYLGVRDQKGAEELSRRIGETTVAFEGSNFSSGAQISGSSDGSEFKGSSNISASGQQSINYAARPLLTASEVFEFLFHRFDDDPDLATAKTAIQDFAGVVTPVRSFFLPWYWWGMLQSRFGPRYFDRPQSRWFPHLWAGLNTDYFGGQLAPLTRLEYVDWSMGRDGLNPGNPDVMGMYDREHNRILIAAVVLVIEDDMNSAEMRGDAAGQAHALRCFTFLARLLLHEMLHQAVETLDGGHDGAHGERFYQRACRVWEASRHIEGGLQFDRPTRENVSHWPGMENIVNLMEANDALPPLQR